MKRNMVGGLAALLALSAAVRLPASADAGALPSYSLGGTLEARPFARLPLRGSAGDLAYGSTTSLGLELGASGERARAAASIEAAVLSGAAAEDAWAAWAAAKALGLDEAGLLLAPAYDGSSAPRTLLEARIRALYVKLDWGWASATAGRQVINYRRGALWSPTDLFTELDLSGVTPLRRGSDALRLVLPLGATGALDLAAAPAARLAEGRYAARLALLLGGADCAAVAYRDGIARAWSAGADFKADLVAGLDGSALYSIPDSGRAWLRATGGLDYSFGDFVAAAEYYYNGGGSAADANAPGSRNAYTALSWKASDFFALTASAIAGLSARTLAATFAASIDAAQNAAVLAYARASLAGSAWTGEAGAGITVKF